MPAVMSKLNNESGLTKQEWVTVSRNPLPSKVKLLNTIKVAVNENVEKNLHCDANARQCVLGDELYQRIRPLLVERKFFQKKEENEKKDEKEKKEAPKKKADKIRIDSTKVRIENLVKGMLIAFNLIVPTVGEGFRSNYMELIGVTFMHLAIFYQQNMTKDEKTVYGLMISMQKFRTIAAHYIGNDPVFPGMEMKISSMFLDDFNEIYDALDKKHPFDPQKISQLYPELLNYSPFDEFVPGSGIQLYEYQKRMFEMLRRSLKTPHGFFAVCSTASGAGKTSTVAGMGLLMKDPYVLLYVCSYRHVRIQVCTDLCAIGVSFAFANFHDDGKVKMTQPWITAEQPIRVIVSSPEVAYQILTESPDRDSFVLVVDETTTGADRGDSKELAEVVKLSSVAPIRTFMFSATSPKVDEFRLIINEMGNRATIQEECISSQTVLVSQRVQTLTGIQIEPYSNCKDSDDIRRVIAACSNVPSLARMITAAGAVRLMEMIRQMRVVGVPDYQSLFKDVANLSPSKIKTLVVDVLLPLVATLSPAQIEAICKIPKRNTTSNLLTFKFDEISTTAPWSGPTLILDPNPHDFATVNAKKLLVCLQEATVPSLHDIVQQYDKGVVNVKNEKKVMEKKMLSKKKKNDDGDVKDVTRTDDIAPSVLLPDWVQVATSSHQQKFRGQVQQVRDSIDPEEIITHSVERGKNTVRFIDVTVVHDDLIILLMCGIGVYDPNDSRLDADYNALVVSLSSQGRLAYVISNVSMVYGTNHPFSRVIITPEFADNHSPQTVCQGMDRSGRVGKCGKAETLVTVETAMKILDFVQRPEFYDVEKKNFAAAIAKCLAEKKANSPQPVDIQGTLTCSNPERKSLDASVSSVSSVSLLCSAWEDDFDLSPTTETKTTEGKTVEGDKSGSWEDEFDLSPPETTGDTSGSWEDADDSLPLPLPEVKTNADVKTSSREDDLSPSRFEKSEDDKVAITWEETDSHTMTAVKLPIHKNSVRVELSPVVTESWRSQSRLTPEKQSNRYLPPQLRQTPEDSGRCPSNITTNNGKYKPPSARNNSYSASRSY